MLGAVGVTNNLWSQDTSANLPHQITVASCPKPCLKSQQILFHPKKRSNGLRQSKTTWPELPDAVCNAQQVSIFSSNYHPLRPLSLGNKMGVEVSSVKTLSVAYVATPSTVMVFQLLLMTSENCRAVACRNLGSGTTAEVCAADTRTATGPPPA